MPDHSGRAPAPRPVRTRAARGGISATVAIIVVLAGASQAQAATFAPPDGTILSGAAVEWPPSNHDAFAARTGQPGMAIHHRFSGWMEPLSALTRSSRRVDAALMISWRPLASKASARGGTVAKVADGEIDRYLVRSARTVGAHPRPVYLRPYWEMNGDWFAWSSFDGSRARPGSSTADFRRAWRRIHIIFRGGPRARVDARLRSAGLPRLAAPGSRFARATDNAAFVWSLTKGHAKPRGRVRNADYYPGNGYVDWVGLSFHPWKDRPVSHWMASLPNSSDPLARGNDLYRWAAARGKPFMLSEWSVAERPSGNGDDAAWIDDTLAWMERRPKAKAQVYFERDHRGKSHLLADHPKARSAFAARVRASRYETDWRTVRTASGRPARG